MRRVNTKTRKPQVVKIIHKILNGIERQLIKIDKNKITALQMSENRRISKREAHSLYEDENRSRALFEKIIRHGVEMCLLCEIIQDNVLKR